MSWKPEEEKKEKKEMQSECFGRSRSDATRSEEKVRYSTFTLDNWYKANLTPMLCNKISCVFLKVKEIIQH